MVKEKKYVWGQGPMDSPGIIVGEAPGAEEEASGIPFVGESGKMLNEALEMAGISREQVFVTNAYKLRPPNNATPSYKMIDEHQPMLEGEFEDVLPRSSLVLGNVPLYAVTGIKGGITRLRGKWIHAVMPTYHPSYVLRRGGRDTFAAHEFYGDVKKWVEWTF